MLPRLRIGRHQPAALQFDSPAAHAAGALNARHGNLRPYARASTGQQVKANPNRAKFGFGKRRPSSISTCSAPTRIWTPSRPPTRPTRSQIDYINELSALARSKNMPVIWTYVAYMDNADDAGVWGTRTNTPDSLQNIKVGDARSRAGPAAGDRPRSATPSSTSAWPAYSMKH